jgi:hypothetical protein
MIKRFVIIDNAFLQNAYRAGGAANVARLSSGDTILIRGIVSRGGGHW